MRLVMERGGTCPNRVAGRAGRSNRVRAASGSLFGADPEYRPKYGIPARECTRVVELHVAHYRQPSWLGQGEVTGMDSFTTGRIHDRFHRRWKRKYGGYFVSAPGWYPDPNNAGVVRFWTGTSWSGERSWDGSAWVDRVPAAVPAPAFVVDASGTRAKPTPRVRTRLLLIIAGAVLMIIGCVLPWAHRTTGSPPSPSRARPRAAARYPS